MIWGCDLGSRKIALACPEQAIAVRLRLPSRRKTDPVLVDDDTALLADFVRQHVPPDATFWVEKPIVGASGNRQTAIHMGISAGRIMGAHPGRSYLVLPMVWKAAVVGHGHADKPACKAWLAREHQTLSEACENDEDLTDATCVGLYGVAAAAAFLEDAGPLSERGRPRPVLRRRQQAAHGEGRRGRGQAVVREVPGSP